jgi:transposase-like protein
VARKKRRYTVEQKLEMLEEARAPGATVAEVCRRHGIDGTTFYRWEKQAKAGMREALNGRRRGRGSKDREIERLKRELWKKRRIIAEVVEENLELKRGLSE